MFASGAARSKVGRFHLKQMVTSGAARSKLLFDFCFILVRFLLYLFGTFTLNFDFQKCTCSEWPLNLHTKELSTH